MLALWFQALHWKALNYQYITSTVEKEWDSAQQLQLGLGQGAEAPHPAGCARVWFWMGLSVQGQFWGQGLEIPVWHWMGLRMGVVSNNFYGLLCSLDSEKSPCEFGVTRNVHPEAAVRVVQCMARFMAAYFTNEPLCILPPHSVNVLPPLHIKTGKICKQIFSCLGFYTWYLKSVSYGDCTVFSCYSSLPLFLNPPLLVLTSWLAEIVGVSCYSELTLAYLPFIFIPCLLHSLWQ